MKAAFPDLAIAVDANGSYRMPADTKSLIEFDRLEPAYIEQPLPRDDLDGHRRLRSLLSAPICLDESIGEEAADIVCIKPGLLGLETSRQIHDRAVAAGISCKASGLFETSIGKGHTVAIGTLPGFEYFSWVSLPCDPSSCKEYARKSWTVALPACPYTGERPLPAM